MFIRQNLTTTQLFFLKFNVLVYIKTTYKYAKPSDCKEQSQFKGLFPWYICLNIQVCGAVV